MYRPEKDFLYSLGFEKMKTVIDDRYRLTIRTANMSLYYFPLYWSFRYGSAVYFYPTSDKVLQTIVDSLSPHNP